MRGDSNRRLWHLIGPSSDRVFLLSDKTPEKQQTLILEKKSELYLVHFYPKWNNNNINIINNNNNNSNLSDRRFEIGSHKNASWGRYYKTCILWTQEQALGSMIIENDCLTVWRASACRPGDKVKGACEWCRVGLVFQSKGQAIAGSETFQASTWWTARH